jgi:hypothetical protein
VAPSRLAPRADPSILGRSGETLEFAFESVEEQASPAVMFHG